MWEKNNLFIMKFLKTIDWINSQEYFTCIDTAQALVEVAVHFILKLQRAQGNK